MMFKTVQNYYQRWRVRRFWERQWRTPNFRPHWLADTPRLFVLSGFENGWLAPRMKVLEIGCGRGTSAAWLAQHGLQVVAMDVSSHAIEQARNAFPNQPDLEFRCADACGSANILTVFDVIIDTGCLQHIPTRLRDRYCANLLVWSRPGSRFVVTMHNKNRSAGERHSEVQALFSSHFELVCIEEVPPTDAKMFSYLNSVFHFVRR